MSDYTALEVLQHDLSLLKDPVRGKRCAAATHLLETLQNPSTDPFQQSRGGDSMEIAREYETLTAAVLRLFEDGSEKCRETGIALAEELMGRQGPEVLDWIFSAVVSRIGLTPVAEPTEELRLALLDLALHSIETFPNEMAKRGLIDYWRVLSENCLKDAFPEVRRRACHAIVRLCDAEPKRITSISTPLAKAVKDSCLLHKHSAVRADAVDAFAALLSHGASGDLLGDMKDEQDNRTTVYFLYVLSCDQSVTVRLAIVRLLSTCLLDIPDRLDQHRRLLRHLLLLLTDESEEVRLKANTTMLQLGKLHLLDHEDNRIDVEKRHITLKDIDWYADDVYPDMQLHCPTSILFPGNLKFRPSLGARSVVAESARLILPKVLEEVNVLDWLVPYSQVNRRIAALRVLAILIFNCENSIVQSAQDILGALYKSLRDSNVDVRRESLVCVELLGKFMTPGQYLPFVIAKPDAAAEELRLKNEAMQSRESYGSGIITVSSAEPPSDQAVRVPPPTLLSTAAHSVKSCILLSLQYMLYGSSSGLTQNDALAITRTLSSTELLDLDSPALCRSLADCIGAVVTIFANRKFISTPDRPLEAVIRDDVTSRTLDSILFYTLLLISGCEDAAVRKHVLDNVVRKVSECVTGTADGIFALHIGRLLHRHLHEMPVCAFTALVSRANGVQQYASQIMDVFVANLAEIDYRVANREKLLFFASLDDVLFSGRLIFSPQQLDHLLRTTILPHCNYRPGGGALVFRKRAVNALRSTLAPHNLPALYAAMASEQLKVQRQRNEGLTSENAELNDTAAVFRADDSAPAHLLSGISCPLAERILTSFLAALDDSDDAEMRHACVLLLPAAVTLPISSGAAGDVVQHALIRLNDSNDLIRLDTARMLGLILERICFQTKHALVYPHGGNEKTKCGLPDNVEKHLRTERVTAAKESDTLNESSEEHLLLLYPVREEIVDEIYEKMHDIVKTLLLHMDDVEETVGLKPTIRDVLIVLKHLEPGRDLVHNNTKRGSKSKNSQMRSPSEIVVEMARTAMKVHHMTRYCSEVIEG